MGLFARIKLLMALSKMIDNLQKGHNMGAHNYLSTEFLSKTVVQLLIVVGACYGMIPPKYALIAVASLTALYMILRTVYKIQNPGKDLPDLSTIQGIPGLPKVVNVDTTVTTK